MNEKLFVFGSQETLINSDLVGTKVLKHRHCAGKQRTYLFIAQMQIQCQTRPQKRYFQTNKPH